MSVYRLAVVRVDDNPNYDVQKALEAAERQRRGYMANYEQGYNEAPTVEARTLAVELTDAEWESVKRAIVEGWK
jgi:hypothetical protein